MTRVRLLNVVMTMSRASAEAGFMARIVPMVRVRARVVAMVLYRVGAIVMRRG